VTRGGDGHPGGESGLLAGRCPNDHLAVPGQDRCPACGESREETVDLKDAVGEVITWTESKATPPGVRSPNPVAIVAFEVDGREVRAVGGLTDGDVEIGDRVRPVYVAELRDPGAGMRERESQAWDGYRFDPV
jgi:uncharacterized OB-fold protein